MLPATSDSRQAGHSGAGLSVRRAAPGTQAQALRQLGDDHAPGARQPGRLGPSAGARRRESPRWQWQKLAPQPRP